MVDVVSIVVAVLALAGTIAQATISAWISSQSEDRKRQRELRATFAKYHDPLHLAADDLSSKLLNIVDWGFAGFASDDAGEEYREYAFMHTSFVFGQFLAWCHILRRDTQFLRPYTNPGSDNATVVLILRQIREILRSDGMVAPFMIFSGNQHAIGEEMATVDSKSDDRQLLCLGFATFCRRWKSDAEFRGWFRPIVEGLQCLADRTSTNRRRMFPADDIRLRRLQHLLADLIETLDPLRLHSSAAMRCKIPDRGCLCRKCQADSEQYHSKEKGDPIKDPSWRVEV